MNTFYTSEKQTQILIALMKAHGIRNIVVSPGATNVTFVASVQQDSFFNLYSCIDERSAAYIACGLAEESDEPVAISCTGATASRNYLPGLTEAFYRKLPILAITSAQHNGRIGHNFPQVIDRTNPLNDIAKLSVQLSEINTTEDEWTCNVNVNKALLELKRRGGGPVHINLTTTYNNNFDEKKLPEVRAIERITYNDLFPEIDKKRIAVFVGSHSKWNDDLQNSVDRFCEKYNAVVLCDHTSNYRGEFRVLPNLICSQRQYNFEGRNLDLLIHIGDVSGAYLNIKSDDVWRVSPDGEIRDTFKKLTKVFEMEEQDFFDKTSMGKYINQSENSFLTMWKNENKKILEKFPEIPFSNIWIAKQTANLLPKNAVLHLGILHSLRSWNLFEIPNSVLGYSNVGGFGIDGCVSSLIGASLANKDKLYFGVVGDLAFFYDMNSIGNRHIGNNIRLMIINNGKGTEFRNYNHNAAMFGEDAEYYIAAAGHYGNKSRNLVKNYSQDLGFEYLSANNKEEYLKAVERFTISEITEKPIIFEVFTKSQDESDALEAVYNIEISVETVAKNFAKSVLGEKGVKTVKKILKK